MTYKDLNVYQRAYKVAIELHKIAEGDKKITTDQKNRLQSESRDILANIAESFSAKTPKAKRFFNFKARDLIRAIQMDLDFLHDIQRLSDEAYAFLYSEYEVCSKQLYKLNQSILENGNEKRDRKVAAPALAVVAA